VARLAELLTAGILLTRLPLSRFSRHDLPLADAVWAFPLVGGVIGALGGAVYAAGVLLRMPPAVGAVWTLAAMLLATGAFHEDGLADTADGLGGGRTRERKLAIMRDSRIGSFGALALILSLALRGSAIAAIGQPSRVLAALVVAAALGRAAMVVPLLALAPARPDGLAVGLRQLDARRAIAAFAIAVLLAVLLLPTGAALRALAGAAVAAVAMAWLARRQVGGYTGDLLGATSVVSECVAISLLAAS
jgi:adenosylcobinamide-GDP ribazoletransferase